MLTHQLRQLHHTLQVVSIEYLVDCILVDEWTRPLRCWQAQQPKVGISFQHILLRFGCRHDQTQAQRQVIHSLRSKSDGLEEVTQSLHDHDYANLAPTSSGVHDTLQHAGVTPSLIAIMTKYMTFLSLPALLDVFTLLMLLKGVCGTDVT